MPLLPPLLWTLIQNHIQVVLYPHKHWAFLSRFYTLLLLLGVFRHFIVHWCQLSGILEFLADSRDRSRLAYDVIKGIPQWGKPTFCTRLLAVDLSPKLLMNRQSQQGFLQVNGWLFTTEICQYSGYDISKAFGTACLVSGACERCVSLVAFCPSCRYWPH